MAIRVHYKLKIMNYELFDGIFLRTTIHNS